MKTQEKKIYKVDLENGDTLVNMFDYLCSRVNWGKSALDNQGITCMNTLFIELAKDKRIIKP
jgi:hypothetical protein